MIEEHGKQASLYRGYRYDRKARKTNITIFITYDRKARKTSITIPRIPI